MAKDKTAYVCNECGYDSPKWLGRCPSCGTWNSFREVRIAREASSSPRVPAWHSSAGPAGGGTSRQASQRPLRLQEIDATAEPRIDLGDGELNRVLGGGLVPGSIVLLGGEPGIGKSTLVMQTVLGLAGRRVLYVSGEESARQLKLRADRLAQGRPVSEEIHILCETVLEAIFRQIREVQPGLLIIDSIQTITTETQESAAGSIVQVRECAAALLRYAKESATPVLLIGHITKEGTLAGPKILEHIVDTVLQFEGDPHHMYRILRTTKNRFGNSAELGIYEMRQSGLRQVENPSELLLTADRGEMSGIAIAAAVEGIRPLLVEVQALVGSAAYATPQRSATGFDLRRMNMLLAVLEKRIGFKMMQKDVFLNLAGGLRIGDTAIDLPVLAAILSSHMDSPIDASTAMAGEVGLSGEIRPVARIEARLSEAAKLGFTSFLLPEQNFRSLEAAKFPTLRLQPVRKVEQAFRLLFG